MKNYVCWNPGEVRQVINPFAEHISDALFRAIHIDRNINVSRQRATSFAEISDNDWIVTEPRQFLEEFLSESQPHALSVIIGATGSGKSHFIHWMRMNIQPTPKRVVLVVRKSGTNLRKIVEMLIDQLPTHQQTAFRDALTVANDSIHDPILQREQLLSDIAHAIKESDRSNQMGELEHELLEHLPNLLLDPNIRREHFLGDNTVVAKIAENIFSTSSAARRPDEPTLFRPVDFSFAGCDFLKASELARHAIQLILIDEEGNSRAAADIVNNNLNRAIARTISFSGDRIEELMTQLRRNLRSADKELILLVEEFARLQGIDRPLLQTITTQAGVDQCKMRTAIAVTPGFFDSLPTTAYTRTTHIVDMDRTIVEPTDQAIDRVALNQLAARYLNAARLGRDKIEKWGAKAPIGELPPSACDTCEMQSECHTNFGMVDNFGFYPFTESALWNSTLRVHDKALSDVLNPRILQNDLLVELLQNHHIDIRNGQFPTRQMIDKFGGASKLDFTNIDRLERVISKNGDRWIASQDFFFGSANLTPLSVELESAFDIPTIPKDIVDNSGKNTSVITPPEELSKTDVQFNIDVEKLAAWGKGNPLDQVLANKLRPLIFEAVANSIDWDRLGLNRSNFAGGKQLALQPTSFFFDRQRTQQSGSSKVRITIPGELVSPATATNALHGLLLANRNNNVWNFSNADTMLACFLDSLYAWTTETEKQLRVICEPSAHWNSGSASFELLCILAALGGAIKPTYGIPALIDCVFSDNFPNSPSCYEASLQTLYELLMRQRTALRKEVQSQCFCGKGGKVSAFLNPHKARSAAQRIRQGSHLLTMDPPDKLDSIVARLYRRVKQQLPSRAKDEVDFRINWLSLVENELGLPCIKSKIITTLESAFDAVQSSGIDISTSANYKQAIDEFRIVPFDKTVRSVRSLHNDASFFSTLTNIGRGEKQVFSVTKRLIIEAGSFLSEIENSSDPTLRESDAILFKLEANCKQAIESLHMISKSLSTMTNREEV